MVAVSLTVDETTTDIICIKCKRDDSDSPNEIVLCDKCGIGELPFRVIGIYPLSVFSNNMHTDIHIQLHAPNTGMLIKGKGHAIYRKKFVHKVYMYFRK